MKEKILEIFEKSNEKVLSLDQIKLQLENHRGLQNAISDLLKEGIIFKTSKSNAFGLSSYYDYIPAIIIKANKKGLVARSCLDEDKIYYINDIASKGAILNDKVLLNFNSYNAIVKDIIDEFRGPIVGEVCFGRRKYLKPNNDNYPLINLDSNGFTLAEGHIVSCYIRSRFPLLIGTVDEIIGHKDDPSTKIKALAKDSKVNTVFPKEVLEEANSFCEPSEEDFKDRRDLRGELVCTIDGADSKDLDDAISVTKTNEAYYLMVHIADVSHYVTKYSCIDKEALKRSNSIYLCDYVIPMLPHALCNNLCSLNPNTDNLALTCWMKINNNGDIEEYDIFESVINSKYRLNYDDVNDFFNGQHEYPSDLTEMLNNALEVSKLLQKEKKERGEIDLDIKEPQIITGENGEVIDVKVRNRGIAERLIEDFMIAANETVASHYFYQDLPFIYRVHEEPTISKISTFESQVKCFGYSFRPNKNELWPEDFQRFLDSIDNESYKKIIKVLMLRSMSKARYDANNLGHFGLASSCYTHFTSPIRRYSDLLVHRLIKMYMHNEKYNSEKLVNEITYIADLISNNEIKSIELERKVDDIKMAEYMQNHIGDIYEGYVSSIINAGFFVELDNLIEGMVRFDTILDDYYEYYEETQEAVGQASGKRIRLGDKIKVRVDHVNVDKGMIDFEAIDYMKGSKKSGKFNKNHFR